jgi:hypothetical protein
MSSSVSRTALRESATMMPEYSTYTASTISGSLARTGRSSTRGTRTRTDTTKQKDEIWSKLDNLQLLHEQGYLPFI